MTRREKIKEVYKEIKPIVNKNRRYVLVELVPVLLDGIMDSYNRKTITLEHYPSNGIGKRFIVKKEQVSPSLWIALIIFKEMFPYPVDSKKIFNNIILSNPKKYYIK